MRNLSDGIKIGLALSGLLLAVVYVLASGRTPDQSADPHAGIRSGTGAQKENSVEGPGKENVSPTYYQRIQELTDEIEKNPDDTTSIRVLARFYQDAHQYEESAALYEQYVKSHPTNRQAWLDLAGVYADDDDMEMALSASDRALIYFPDDPAVQYNLGAVLANQGAFEAARGWWERVSSQTLDTELREAARQSLEQLKGQ